MTNILDTMIDIGIFNPYHTKFTHVACLFKQREET